MTEPEITPEPAPVPSPFPKIKRAFIIMLVVLGVVGIANTFIAPRMLNPTPSAPPAVVPPPPAELPPAPVEEATTTDAKRVHELETRLASLEERLKEQAEIEEYASKKASGALKIVSYWQAYDELKATLLSGAPYADALQRFRSLTQDNNALLKSLEPLAANQEEGIATPEQLHVLFRDGLKAALKSDAAEPQTLTETIRHNLRGLIVIRKIGEQEGTSVEATLARAEVALKASQLTQAITAIETLPVEAQEPMHAFVVQAKAREQALRTLQDIRGLLAPPKREE